MQLNRRTFLFGTTAAAFAAKKPAPAPPNVLLIVADDVASWMLGCYGNKEFRTPNIDTLALSGTRFVNSFTCAPACSAGRATLLTGRVPQQHGIEDFLDEHPLENPPQGQAAPPASFASEVMLPDILSKQGYNCGHTGKWHLGDDAQPKHGYQYTYTFAGASTTNQNPKMYLNGKAIEEQGYLGDLITQKACGFLDQQSAGKPFFLTVAHLSPHSPYDGHPQKYYDMYAGTKFETVGYESPATNALRDKEMLRNVVGNIRKYAAGVTALDDQISPLLKKLQERKLWDNTLIVFTSDSGYLLGRHGLWSKAEASDPYNMYEEVVHVPLIWSWPGKVPADLYLPELVSSYDFVPTICELTGSAAPQRNLCGRSYAPMVLRERFPKKEPWTNLVFGHLRNTEMVRDKRFKLIVRNGGSGPNELYDLVADPHERTNQHGNTQFISVRDQLTKELQAWHKRVS